jgi:phosphoenolpyruvate carboxykinase (GTP)
MSMRPFMAYSEGDYAAHWLRVIGQATKPPIFAHVNWFQRDPDDGHFRWPGYRENLRALLWLVELKEGLVSGRETPVGVLPLREELRLDGLEIDEEDLDVILDLDLERWCQEMGFREAHLREFQNLPEEIWEAHRRVAAGLEAERLEYERQEEARLEAGQAP